MITREELMDMLTYNPESGLFTWNKERKFCQFIKGSVAGYYEIDGYHYIYIKPKLHLAHRLAFLYMQGSMPPFVDHKNKIKNDNRWCNLRACTGSENQQNKRLDKRNSVGFSGIHYSKSRNRFIVRFKIPGIGKVSFGSFKNLEDAKEACIAAKRKYHPFNEDCLNHKNT